MRVIGLTFNVGKTTHKVQHGVKILNVKLVRTYFQLKREANIA